MQDAATSRPVEAPLEAAALRDTASQAAALSEPELRDALRRARAAAAAAEARASAAEARAVRAEAAAASACALRDAAAAELARVPPAMAALSAALERERRRAAEAEARHVDRSADADAARVVLEAADAAEARAVQCEAALAAERSTCEVLRRRLADSEEASLQLRAVADEVGVSTRSSSNAGDTAAADAADAEADAAESASAALLAAKAEAEELRRALRKLEEVCTAQREGRGASAGRTMDPSAAAAAVERANAALWAEKQRASEAEARLQKRAEELHAARDRAVLEARRLRRALAAREGSSAGASPTAAAAAPAVDSLSPLLSPSPPAIPKPRRQLKSRLAPRRSGSSDEDDDGASPVVAGSTPPATPHDAATPLSTQRPPRSPGLGSRSTFSSPRLEVRRADAAQQQPRQAEVSPLEAAFAGFNRDMAEGLNAVGNLFTSPLRVLAPPVAQPLLPSAGSGGEGQQERRPPRPGN